MRMRIVARRVVMIGVLVVLLGAAPPAGTNTPAPLEPTIAGFTMPMETHNLSFLASGVIGAVAVKPGDVVKKGQELMSQDTDLEELELKRMQVEGNSTQQIEGQMKDRDSKKLERDNMQQAHDRQACTESEWLEAILAYDISEVKIHMAEEEHQEKMLDAEKQAKKVEKMRIFSPVDGIVKDVNLEVGEVVDPNKPEGAIIVVKNDPLKVRIDVPSAQGVKLKLNDEMRVAYADQPDKWMTATVTYLSPVVDSASDTREIRLEMANTDNRPAGLQVIVKLPDELAAK